LAADGGDTVHHDLSKRERQIIEAIYAMGSASVAEVRSAIPAPPGYSAVRAMLNVLVRKGVLSHRNEGRRYVYFPLVRRHKARQFAVKRLLEIYFDNSVPEAVSGLIRADHKNLTAEDYEDLIELINEARKRTPVK
jgi:BlaI family penicillinase repressor